MMYGLREPFSYLECSSCGCVQLLDVPEALGKYYPEDYYSFSGSKTGSDRGVVATLRRARTDLALRLPVALTERLVLHDRLPGMFRWLAGLGLRTSSPIADVGCGNGQKLIGLERQGFTRLFGYDPYLGQDERIGDHIQLRRAGVTDIADTYELIMIHHAFEHMPEPRLVLERLAARLSPRGAVLIRIPVADSWAWRHFGVDWVGLDPPRHLFAHTERSIEILAAECGLKVQRVFRDSVWLQFWGSELYRRDIPLREWDRDPELFSQHELAGLRRQAEALNRSGSGDSAGFVLTVR